MVRGRVQENSLNDFFVKLTKIKFVTKNYYFCRKFAIKMLDQIMISPKNYFLNKILIFE